MKLTNITPKKEPDFSKIADAYLDSKGDICVPVIVYAYDVYCERVVPTYALHSITELAKVKIDSGDSYCMEDFLAFVKDSGEYTPVTISNIEFSENVK